MTSHDDMRLRATAWLDHGTTRESALNEQHMALDVLELLDDVTAMRKLLAEAESIETSSRVAKLRQWADERMAQAKATAESEPWQRFDCHEQSMALVRLNTLHAVLAILSGTDEPGPAVHG